MRFTAVPLDPLTACGSHVRWRARDVVVPPPQEFAKIYELCEYILDRSQRPSLLNGTLLTLQRFLTWIPLGYIFERQLIE